MRIHPEEWAEHLKQQKATENKQVTQETITKAIETGNRGRPLTEHETAFAKSMAENVLGESKQATRARVQPPAGMRWGGTSLFQRDIEHCPCGLLIKDHIPANMKGISCPYYKEKK